MYNRSEFTLSPAINFGNTSSTYLGTNTKESKSVFNIPGLSLVINLPAKEEGSFLGGSFGISMSRTNDFQHDYKFSGVNDQSSIVDYFIDDATSNGIDPEEMLQGGDDFYHITSLAYNNYLIEDFTDQEGVFYDSRLLFTSGRQQESSQRKGAQYQWSFAYGANFSDKFYAGATLGITSLRFKLNQVYTESDFQYPDTVSLEDLTLEENYDIKGSGINFTLGAIYRPVDFLQFGVSYVTPSYYSISDSYTARIETNWNNYDYYRDITDDDNLNNVSEEFDAPLISEYSLTTPGKLSAGATFISKIGFLSADIEYVNYARAKYSADIADEYEAENDDVRAEYKSVINYRAGAEYRFSKYRVRTGFNYMADPMVRTNNINRSILGFSGGFGYREKNFFIDLAGQFLKTEGNRTPYFVNGATPVAAQKFTNNNYILTLGFIF
jgi:hypothetical protein